MYCSANGCKQASARTNANDSMICKAKGMFIQLTDTMKCLSDFNALGCLEGEGNAPDNSR